MALVVEKGYEPITVKDICDRADIARTTFYMHYRDKDDLLKQLLEDFFAEMLENLQDLELERSLQYFEETGQSIDRGMDFEHIARHAEFYRVMLSDRGSMIFTNYLSERLKYILMNQVSERLKLPLKPRMPTDFIASYLIGGLIGVYQWWLNEQPSLSPEELDHYFASITLRGVLWAIGVEGED